MGKLLDGETFRNMIMEGACAIEDKKIEANELNVFPVPDGDTGTNMSLTMANAYKEMEHLASPTLGQAAERTAAALLRGARGNSGVILSLLFRGFAKELKGANHCDGAQFADALAEGVSTAYKAVMKPAEGTILTVSRRAAEAAALAAEEGKDLDEVFAAAIARCHTALAETPSQNPVLEKAGVVDAGAFGLIAIFEGMYAVMTGKDRRALSAVSGAASAGSAFESFETEDIRFAYCTEFIAEKKDRRRSVGKLRNFLQNIGDSAVVVDDDEIVKVHVHTNSPDRVLGEALKFGPLLTVKIENMRQQHSELVLTEDELAGKKTVAPPERKYGFVSVAAGEGMIAIFKDLGVDQVVSGGQTMNPSTEDILAAAEQTPAEIVFVLPNNKNIIMAAEQAASLCTERQIVVVPSVTIPQGISAMLAFNPEESREENMEAMKAALATVRTGQVTYAVRDSDFGGKRIKSGDYISLLDNKLFVHGKNKEAVLKKLAREMTKKATSYVTVIYGEGVSEDEAKEVADLLQKESNGAEVNVICGGQPVYYFILSAE